MNDYLTIGAEFGYDPSWANYNAHALYSGGNAKLSLPGTGFSVSGAFGHYFPRHGRRHLWTELHPARHKGHSGLQAVELQHLEHRRVL